MSNAHHPPFRIEQALREKLSSQGRHEVSRLIGWDDSQTSRFLSGQMGVVIDKLDALVGAAGFVLVTRRYLDAVSTLGEVGMHCECAREGLGECGRGA